MKYQTLPYSWKVWGMSSGHPRRKERKKVWRRMNRASLTSLVLRLRIRSRSSTSCLKVGLCDEMACQQSFIIMYLSDRKLQLVYPERECGWWEEQHHTHTVQTPSVHSQTAWWSDSTALIIDVSACMCSYINCAYQLNKCHCQWGHW